MFKLNFIGSRGWMQYVGGEVAIELFYIGTIIHLSKDQADEFSINELRNFNSRLKAEYNETN